MYKLGGLSTIQIENALKNISSFIGCFGSDKIPPVIKYPSSFVVNTEKESEPGTHWVAVYLTKTTCYYFDSFGVGVLENDIWNFLKTYYSKVIYSTIQIQHFTSVTCGHFCIGFLKLVNNKKSYMRFIHRFDHFDLIENDNTVIQILTSCE